MSTALRRTTKRPTISIVGSGRLGTALARALFLSGYEIEAVVARRTARARRAAALLGRKTQPLAATDLHTLPASQVVFICTPDDDIEAIATRMAMSYKGPVRGRTVLHTSGALSSSEVLKPLAAKGFHTGSLHPLVSVSDPLVGASNLLGAFYCIEGDAAASRAARSIVKDLKGNGFHIPSRHKPLYHAAAVMASGHVVALFSLATEMLTHCGLDSKTARRVLLPLLESTVANLSASNSAQALTGTFARGDLATMQRHLAALSGKNFADALVAYKLLGRQSLKLAQERLDPGIQKQLRRALD